METLWAVGRRGGSQGPWARGWGGARARALAERRAQGARGMLHAWGQPGRAQRRACACTCAAPGASCSCCMAAAPAACSGEAAAAAACLLTAFLRLPREAAGGGEGALVEGPSACAWSVGAGGACGPMRPDPMHVLCVRARACALPCRVRSGPPAAVRACRRVPPPAQQQPAAGDDAWPPSWSDGQKLLLAVGAMGGGGALQRELPY